MAKMPLKAYYIVSQEGMLPGTIVHVNAGKELAKIDSLSGITFARTNPLICASRTFSNNYEEIACSLHIEKIQTYIIQGQGD